VLISYELFIWYDDSHFEMTGTKHTGLAPDKITPMLGVLATKPGLRDSKKWLVYRPGSLNRTVTHIEC
jgi:hypothetical protein